MQWKMNIIKWCRCGKCKLHNVTSLGIADINTLKLAGVRVRVIIWGWRAVLQCYSTTHIQNDVYNVHQSPEA